MGVVWWVVGAEGVMGVEGGGAAGTEGAEGWRREEERRLARGGKPLQRR